MEGSNGQAGEQPVCVIQIVMMANGSVSAQMRGPSEIVIRGVLDKGREVMEGEFAKHRGPRVELPSFQDFKNLRG